MRLFLYLWKVQGASTHLKVVSATKQSLHRAVAGTLGICASTEYKWSQSLLSPHRDGGQLSVTHSWWLIALPGSCLCLAEHSRRQAGPSPNSSAPFQTSSNAKHQNHNWKRFSDCTAGGQQNKRKSFLYKAFCKP